MNRTTWRIIIPVLAISLALLGSAGAQEQQHQQHHPDSAQGTEAQTPPQTPEDPAPMMQQMHGMMQQMHGMMQQMHGGMGSGMMRGGMMRGPGGGVGHGMMMQRKLERLTQELELTGDQKTQVQSLLRTEAKEVIRLQADIDTTTIDLHQLLDTEPVDMARVKTTLQTIAMKEADLRLAHITRMEEIRKLLTPEQRQKFSMSRAHMMGRGGMGKHGHMMGRKGMPMHGKGMRHGGMQGKMAKPCCMQGDKPKH